ncbi:MAG: methyltransferase domain-containing protein [Bacteroidales bacterium]|nr:methyltransferase domain-containing protein [Bacteroidales bacterium]
MANTKEEDVVLDLGSGAGIGVFIARGKVGESGKVIGVDFAKVMIEKANKNKVKLGYKNVEFILGDIENLPILSESVDVVISNWVINLVHSKKKVYHEIFRVLKSGGHFCISDVSLNSDLPKGILDIVEM